MIVGMYDTKQMVNQRVQQRGSRHIYQTAPVSAPNNNFAPLQTKQTSNSQPTQVVTEQNTTPHHKNKQTFQDSSYYSCDSKGYMNFVEYLVVKGRYRLQKRIGKGTFSKVFAAKDLKTQNWVALKVVRNTDKYQMAAKVEYHILDMIKKEDKKGESNCIQVLDQFIYNGHPCFVFDLLGRNLYAFLHANKYMPFALSHVRHFIRQILQGVSFLHERQVIFTDLKPENIVFVFDKTIKKGIHDITVEIPRDTRIRLIDFWFCSFMQVDIIPI
eukprot:UN32140